MNMVITNRDLLRKYKELKEHLLNGDVDEIVVPQKGNIILKITLQKEKTPFEKMMERILEKPCKNLKRPEEDII